ncbi:MAG: uL15 family ribosomal protein [Patescibacteria group bacterium]
MQIHQIKRNTKRAVSRQIGRGGTRGKTSGKGMKGQKARAGRKIRPEMRDTIKKLPKHRGYKFSSHRLTATPINLSEINKTFKAGEQVSPKTLFRAGLIRKRSGVLPVVKILGKGHLGHSVVVSNCLLSDTARQVIEKAGGEIKL